MTETGPVSDDSLTKLSSNSNVDFRHVRKAELHAHFNGSIPRAAISSIIQERGLSQDLIPPVFIEPVASMEAYLEPWKLYRQWPNDQAALDYYALAIASDFAKDGVVYAELRHTAIEIAITNSIPLSQALERLLQALESASTGEIDLRLIVGLSRWRASEELLSDLYDALRNHRSNRRLVGVDLSGDELAPVHEGTERFFQRVRSDLNLKVTIHAGEHGNAANVRWAIEKCRADRVGHGIAAATDPSLLDLLLSSHCVVETCLTSNYLTKAIPSVAASPMKALLDGGVPVVLGTDNCALHGKWLSDEYELATLLVGAERARQLARDSFRHRFGS